MAKILICDDSQTMLHLFEKRLRDAGHEIVALARDGDEGFKAYSEKRPELTLLDVTMPNRDGRDCLGDILKLQPNAKVIMISAVTDGAVIKDCLRVGAKAFVSKGQLFQEAEFKKEVLTLIDQVLKAA
jgi:two-component system chemotaxis response regulator CheY